MKMFEDYLQKHKNYDQQRIEKIYGSMKTMLSYVAASGHKKLDKKKGNYELIGCDVMIDSNDQPFLIELNTNPAMFCDTQNQKEILPELMKNVIDLEIQLHKNQNIQNFQPFELLYSEQFKLFK